ncbi:P450 monooxygenase [Mucor ambiguus]|uniref:p450 monooxygenase n=1 Tax=Mucor ambiguus TaxID=91626 RepID=A0A0C9MU40_9FUNG|nr:P450 monooxygenase [Mucor ambiguus]
MVYMNATHHNPNKKLYIAFFGPLSKVPGPFIAKFMGLPSPVYNMPTGTLFASLKRLHDIHGAVVRIGPESISVADKDMIKQILIHDDLPKGSVYRHLRKTGETMLNTQDRQLHKKKATDQRKMAAHAFSIKYINSLEPYMEGVLKTMIDKVQENIQGTIDDEGYGSVDLWRIMSCAALDIIGETAFGETFHMLEDGTHFLPKLVKLWMKIAAYVTAYPFLFKLVRNGPNPKVMNFVMGMYEKRKASGVKRNDILQVLVDTQDDPDPEKRMTTKDLLKETFLYLAAGWDTSGNTIGFALVELLRNPDKLAKLYQEIDTLAFMEGTELLHTEQLKALPYLNGVIHETLRIYPVPGAGLHRRTEKEINLRGELVLPKDIEVTANMYHAHNNDAYWPSASKFIPERWIPGEEDYNQVIDHDCFFTFSAGSRNCIGKNFALQELRLSLANFFKYYEIKPIPEEMEEALNLRHYVTLTVEKSSFRAKLNEKEETGGDVEVSWVDQQRINEFSQYNAKIDDLEEQYEKLKQEKEYLDDVAMELELADEDEAVRYKVGDAFVHVSASEAIEKVEKDSEKLGLALEDVKHQIDAVQEKMEQLKKDLYAKFGNAINLEKE